MGVGWRFVALEEQYFGSYVLVVRGMGEIRIVEGVCCGCNQVYYCGELQLPSCSELSNESGNLTDTSSLLEKTFDESSICAMSTPLPKSKPMTLVSPRAESGEAKSKASWFSTGTAVEGRGLGEGPIA
ncbi:unnamed protein product [Heligmosomoides polygyrus]|uniref:Uncharacterized protein n=1 Tax=Heligmosomoides polygyrus TaxID=6339 RepID=A0A183FRI1_HELPZ|nr:unnamed protein product [Heligmosomoides polygyrus]